MTKKVEVKWNPTQGTEKPFREISSTEGYFTPMLYRGKKVVAMDGNVYFVSKSWYDFHPGLENGAILTPIH